MTVLNKALAPRTRKFADMYAYCAEGFGAEVKRRIMVGTYTLFAGYYDAYYIKARADFD